MTPGIRGLPYKPRKISKDEITKLRDNHVWTIAPSLETVEMIFVTIDTMDDFFSYAVFAWDVNDSLYMIENGETQYMELDDEKREQINKELQAAGKPPVVTLEDVSDKDYLVKDGVGIKPYFMVIDQGGHRGDEVKHFAKMHRRVYMQKGTALTSLNWKPSDNQYHLVITNEKYYKSTTIYYLYSQKNKQENFLWFNPSISEETLAEIRDVVPDNSSKWGDQPANWISKTGKDHAFDCLKYAYLARDMVLQLAEDISLFRFGKAPSILRCFAQAQRTQEIIQQQEVTQFQDNETMNFWDAPYE